MNDLDLFIILKAILWYTPQCTLPTDEEIKKFIEVQKQKIKFN